MQIFFLIILVFIFIILSLFYIILILGIFLFYDIKNKVFFVPSQRKIVEEFFKIYPFEKNKIFFDLGSGDGRVVFLAEKKGLKAYGIDNNLALYCLSNFLKRIYKSKAIFIRQDIRKAEIEQADYIYLYLLPKFMEEIEDNLFLKIKNDAKVISFCFEFKKKKPKEVYLGKFYIYEK
jgi:SAM-dependent methyltransferase